MNPWIVAGAFLGVLYLVGRRSRRATADPTVGPESSPFMVAGAGAEELWLEVRDAFGAPIGTLGEHEVRAAGIGNGPVVPFGN